MAGAGRSGTSTMAGLMQILGLHVPQPEVAADETNPKGFSEPRWVVDHHDRLLKEALVQVSDSRPDAWFETGRVSTREHERITTAEWLESHFAGQPRAGREGPAAELVPDPVARRRGPHRRDPRLRDDAAPAGRGRRQQADLLRQQARLDRTSRRPGSTCCSTPSAAPASPSADGRPGLRALRRPARRLDQAHHARRGDPRAAGRAARRQRADPRRPPVRRPVAAADGPEPRRPRPAAAPARARRRDLDQLNKLAEPGGDTPEAHADPRPAARGLHRPVRRGRGDLPVLGGRRRAAHPARRARPARRRWPGGRGRAERRPRAPTRCRTALRAAVPPPVRRGLRKMAGQRAPR